MLRFRLIFILSLVLLGAAAPAVQARPLKMMWYDGKRGVDQAFADMKTLQVDVVQTTLYWNAIAPARPADARDPADGAYNWSSETDEVVARARRNRMRVALMVVATPSWANGGRSWSWAPSRPRDFADFAVAAAKRYPHVRLWMVWGEPSSHEKLKPSTPQSSPSQRTLTRAQRRGPETYARLVDTTYGALKRLNRGNRILGGMSYVTGHIRAGNWARYMRLPNGKPPRMDLYGHNPFSAREPDLTNGPSPQRAIDMSDLRRFQRVVDRYLARPRGKRRLRLFLSEFTIPTAPDPEFNFYTTPNVQARWIRSAFRVARQVDAYGLGWIHLYDKQGTTSAGLVTEAGMRKPGFAAFRGA